MGIILFGAGSLLDETITNLNNGVRIVAIVDNDKNKWGTKYKGIKITAPDKIRCLRYEAIIVSNERFSNQIKSQLIEMKLKHILTPYDKNLSYSDIGQLKKYMKISFLTTMYAKRMLERQIFFPELLGVFTNPYYFSRRLLWKSIEKNKKYISGKCMDFGCGTMPYCKLFKTEKYYGVEIESEQKNGNITYYDGKHIPFDDEYFNSIICSEVLEHIPNIDEIIVELKRVLVPGGYLLVTVPFTYPEHCKPYDYRRYTSMGVKKLFSDHGFKVVKQVKSGSFVNAISQMRGVYINEKLTKEGIMKYLKYLLVATNNITGMVSDSVLPYDNDLYLDNLIVLKKI